jgi:hypothetical protein
MERIFPLLGWCPPFRALFTFGSGAPGELRQKQHWPVYLDEVLSSRVARSYKRNKDAYETGWAEGAKVSRRFTRLFEGLNMLVVAVYNTHLDFPGVQTQTSMRAARSSSTPSNL